MDIYLGVKLMKAEPQLFGVHYGLNKTKQTVNDSTFNKEGYRVIYEDGHESWSPKKAFEKFYRRIDNLTFGLAIEALKKGKLVSRKGWNGKDMFVMKQIPAEISLDTIPKMQSVQQSAKDKLIERQTTLKYENQMLIIKPDGTADSWVASSSDIFAEDWFIVE